MSIVRGRWTRRVTAVVGGAGAGKTTLLAQALTDNRIDPQGVDVWLRCVEADAAMTNFGSALCAALGVDPPPHDEPEGMVGAIAAGVLAHAPVPVALVLDDLHLIEECSEGAALLTQLVDHLPASTHLVLGSRRKPPIALARLVAQGDALVVGEDDLAFTTDELEAFAGLRGLSPTERAGLAPWPALAELMASAGPTVVRDYLWEEVLGGMPTPRRRQLAILAAIGGGDRPLLTHAVGSAVDLDELVEAIPLVSATREGWIELHALWHDQLEDELGPDHRRSAQRRAAEHLLERGDRDRAFRLLTDARATTELAALVMEVATHVYLPVAPDVLNGWLRDLKGLDLPTGQPEVKVLQALLAKERTGEMATARALLEEAREEFAGRTDPAGELACLVHLFSIGFSQDDGELLADTIVRGQALAASGHAAAAPIAAIGRAGMADFFGDFEGALGLLDATPSLTSDEWDAIRAWMRAELLESLGHPTAALETVADCRYRGGGLIRDQLDGARVQALWSSGRVEEALATGLIALERAGTTGSVRTSQRGHALAARYQSYLGDLGEADAHLRAVDRHPPADRLITRRRHIARAARFVLVGDELAAAEELAWLFEGDELNSFLHAQKTVLRVLPLVYVLAPGTRRTWHEAPLGPTFVEWRTLAQALVAVREAGDLDLVTSLPPVATGTVRSGFPLPWAVELATALDAVGRPEGQDLLVAVGAVGHPFLAALTEGGPLAGAARGLINDIPRPPDQVVEVRFLGPPELRRDGVPMDEPGWRRERVRQLLAYLVLHGSASREEVADALWPDLEPAAANNNLRGTLSHLLGVLQPGRRSREPSYFVHTADRAITLTGTDRLRVDVWDLERHLDTAERAERVGTPSLALSAGRAAVDLWRGPFAADAPWAWAEGDAERLRHRFVRATARAAELTLGGGDDAGAERLAGLVIDLDPWSERAYRVLATAQLDRGDRDGARLTMLRCRKALAELGVEPERATSMLERRLTVGPPG